MSAAMGEVDRVTQQNVASAEEPSSAAFELSCQAGELAAMVSTFQLAHEAGAPPARQVERPCGAAVASGSAQIAVEFGAGANSG